MLDNSIIKLAQKEKEKAIKKFKEKYREQLHPKIEAGAEAGYEMALHKLSMADCNYKVEAIPFIIETRIRFEVMKMDKK